MTVIHKKTSDGNAMCNWLMNTDEKNTTTRWDRVTCKNCLRMRKEK